MSMASVDEQAPLVIVGSGMAGNQLLKQFRKLNSEREVVVICADSGDFYSKPMLSNALKQHKTPAQLRMQTAEQLSQTLNARYQTHTEVLQIDAQKKCLITSAGVQFYSQCVLALGAQPRRLPWQGDAAQQVQAINDWQAYAQFRMQLDALLAHKAASDIRVAVIGAGLVGCEFANDLHSLGVQVLLFSPQAECLFPVFPPQAGAILRDALQQQGINCLMPSTVTHLQQHGEQICIRGEGFDDQQVDLVISAVGLVSQTQLASAAGLRTENGICVDSYLRSSDENIFALGDCAQINAQSLRYILPIMHSSAALAQTLIGTPTAVQLPVMPILLKTPACPMLIAAAAMSVGEWQWQGSGCDWVGLCHDGASQLINFVVTGQCMTEKAHLLKQMSDYG
jgi:rubredoxin-NAD+ reductase